MWTWGPAWARWWAASVGLRGAGGGGGEFGRGGAVGALEAGAVAFGHDVDVVAGLGELVGGFGGAAGRREGFGHGASVHDEAPRGVVTEGLCVCRMGPVCGHSCTRRS